MGGDLLGLGPDVTPIWGVTALLRFLSPFTHGSPKPGN